MSKKTRYIIKLSALLILPLVIISIKALSMYPGYIEKYYSNGFYQHLSAFFRFLLGWVPISLGDLLYTFAIIFILWQVFRFLRYVFYRRNQQVNVRRRTFQVAGLLAIVYIFFNVFWGLNYNRLGIAHQLQIQPEKHKAEDLKILTAALVQKVNVSRRALGNQPLQFPNYDEICQKSADAFKAAEAKFPFLHYENPSVKGSLYGKMGVYFGFLGYYNPFTGEAQVNLTQPKFLIPFVTCHEMAHQLGYANESEANFVGFLAATSSPDLLFQYSAYFDLFNYANRELYLRDSIAAKNNFQQLDSFVKVDRAELRKYLNKKDNYIEPFISLFYDHYLKANQQSSGIKSYNEVVGLLIAYNKKYGRF